MECKLIQPEIKILTLLVLQHGVPGTTFLLSLKLSLKDFYCHYFVVQHTLVVFSNQNDLGKVLMSYPCSSSAVAKVCRKQWG